MIRAFHFVKFIFIALVTKAIALCMIFESALTQKCHIGFSAQRAMILDHTGLYSCDDKFRRNNVWQIYFFFLNCCNAKVQNVLRSMKSWRKLKVIVFFSTHVWKIISRMLTICFFLLDYLELLLFDNCFFFIDTQMQRIHYVIQLTKQISNSQHVASNLQCIHTYLFAYFKLVVLDK